jgi:hypothetical protein
MKVKRSDKSSEISVKQRRKADADLTCQPFKMNYKFPILFMPFPHFFPNLKTTHTDVNNYWKPSLP